jgi:hypothetical protein
MFFSMPQRETEKLKNKIADAEVIIEVLYFSEPEDGSNAVGYVS